MSSSDITTGASGGDMSRSRELLNQSAKLIDNLGWSGLGQSIIGTIALTSALGILDVFNALLSIPISLFQTLAEIIPTINQATIGGIAGFLGAGFSAGAASFNTGWTALLGIFQAPLGVAVGLIMLWEVAYYLDMTDRDFIGFAMDVPDFFLNNDDSGVADEDE